MIIIKVYVPESGDRMDVINNNFLIVFLSICFPTFFHFFPTSVEQMIIMIIIKVCVPRGDRMDVIIMLIASAAMA